MSHGSRSGCLSVLIGHNERDDLRGKSRDPIPKSAGNKKKRQP